MESCTLNRRWSTTRQTCLIPVLQLLSLLLGVGGALILLPQTFGLGGVLLVAHSVVTIGCFVATRDWKGGLLEFAFLQIPIAMVVLGYLISDNYSCRSTTIRFAESGAC